MVGYLAEMHQECIGCSLMTISAVIPCLNTAPPELDAAIHSLRQSKLADEIILVDDHSDNPESIQALQKYAEQGLKVIPSRGCRNTQAARSTGIHHAKHPYILNLDADDLVFNDGLDKQTLAPINFGTSNAPWQPPKTIWEFIESPGPIQWGSIISADLARYVAAETESRHEDLLWGYRLLLTAWRDQIPVRTSSGVRYWWRSEEGRDTMTSRYTRDEKVYRHWQSEGLRHAADFLNLSNAETIRLLGNRRNDVPQHQIEDRQARVDTHILHFSGKIAWLKQCIDSLKPEPTNVQLVVGGFPGSIGQARAYAFTLGSAEYVSFIDDDDYILPWAMQQCVDYLDASPDCVGVYTNRYHLHEDGRMDPEYLRPWHWRRMYSRISEVTHLKVMRRSAVMPYLDELKNWPTWEEYILCCLATQHGRWHHLPIFGAVKRYNDPRKSSIRLSQGNLTQKAKQFALATLIK